MSALTFNDRVRGCLIGGAIGDALGAPIEFWDATRIETTYPEGIREYIPATFGYRTGTGLITDDTQMTLFTIDGIMRARVRLASKGLASIPTMTHVSYLYWLGTQTFPNADAPGAEKMGAFSRGWLASQDWLYSRRAPGNTCLSALEAFHINAPGSALGSPAVNNSKGCGTVMRTAPFGFLRQASPEDAARLAIQSSAITHGHPTAGYSAGALTIIIWHLAHGITLRDALRAAIGWLTTSGTYAVETRQALETAIDTAATQPASRETVERLGGGWIAEEALAIAVYCALTYPGPNQILDALSLAVAHSGDSDSTGAICGNILGTLHGEQALPANLATTVEGRDTILTLADDLTLAVSDGDIAPETYLGVPDEWIARYPG